AIKEQVKLVEEDPKLVQSFFRKKEVAFITN
ncbi:hypothetical protein FHK02_5967, partial [Spirosoma sp. LMG 31448]|nr:hypothetical protein [Spirosoma utsteinense]MBC3789379.1 hypothetical protein [Spirosoma utsteinense]MBC3795083.1 hypothetical protein [Spirosoma utsteinense]